MAEIPGMSATPRYSAKGNPVPVEYLDSGDIAV
jgi:hypothetical protein